MLRTFRYRLRPTQRQVRLLDHVLAVSADLYNAALQERRDAWRKCGKRIGLFDQTRQLTEIRAADPDIAAISAVVAREPLRRVDRAFQGFFRRCKNGENPGYPRFRSRDRYNSFSVSAPSFRIEGNTFHLHKLGGFRIKLHRLLRGAPKHATVARSGNRWSVFIACEIGEATPKRPVSRLVGIDLGLNTFAVLSDGKTIENPRFFSDGADKLAECQRVLCRKRRGSNNRRRARLAVARVHERISNRRANFCHHVSRWLFSNYDLVAFEDLNIRGMVHGNLAKSIHDAAWGLLIRYIIYKAEDAGRWAVPVNPHGTTQLCSRCGRPVPKTLKERWHSCECGLSIGRDDNASRNILALGRSAAGLPPTEVQE